MLSINLYYNQVLILSFHPVYLLQTGSAAARDAELILDRVPEHVVVMLVEDRKHMKIVPEPRAGIWGRRGCQGRVSLGTQRHPARVAGRACTPRRRSSGVPLTPGYPAILSRKVHGSTRLVSEARAEAAKSASPSIVRVRNFAGARVSLAFVTA